MERRQLVEAAVDVWKRHLVDLTGNNRLIYFRQTKSNALNLDGAEAEQLSALVAGKKARLTKLFPSNPEQLDRFLGAAQVMRKVDRTALANREELGIETLFIANTRLTWDASKDSKATPNAPVMLAPLFSNPIGGSQSDFELHRSDEWIVNETLLLFLQEQYGFTHDAAELDAVVEANQGNPVGVATYFADLVSQSGLVKDAQLDAGVLIGNFKYQKMPMVRDLEENVDALAANNLIAAIAGDQDAAMSLRSANAPGEVDERLPNYIEPENEFLVLDADSSQSYVVNAVAAGRSLVVEGPPGTGKSQTISNLIATLAAQGKSVLFVAEKRAAIEAVAKRLEQVGLGELSLDLHGASLKKKELAASLARSLDAVGEAAIPKTGRLHAELAQLRNQLVVYEADLHAVHVPWGLSYFDVAEELSELASVRACQLPDAVVATMNDDAQLSAERLFAELNSIESAVDLSSPWNAMPIRGEAHADQLIDEVAGVRERLLPDLRSALATVESSVPAVGAFSINQLSSFLDLHDGVVEVENHLGSDIWQRDLEALRHSLNSKWAMLPGPKQFRLAKAELSSSMRNKFNLAAVLGSVEKAIEIESQWRYVTGQSPERLPVAPELRRIHSGFVEGAQVLVAADPHLLDSTVADAGRLVAELSTSERTALLRGEETQHRSTLNELGAAPLLALVDSGEVSPDQSAQVLRKSVLEGVRRHVERKSKALGRFEGNHQRATAAQYSSRDQAHIASAGDRVKRTVAERVVQVRNEFADQNALIEREAKKKTRHRTLRQLQDGAGDVLTALKPCWMMSPLMVAQALPPKPMFDYVVFDEASQIPPADAVSSLLRGKNVVVAGDRRQLPPSAFFDSGSSGDLDEYDEEAVDALLVGFESLLDVVSVALPSRMLNWHYRSNDDRLIALSNEHIYEGALTTFPGAQQTSPIRFHRVHHVPANKTEVRSNSTEVNRVVELMIEHANERPEMSLGVIAFGQAHASAIEDRLRETLVELGDAVLDDYFDEGKQERVFVKNIERVQGDERDAIILTIGYGRDVTGKVPLRFGPVNSDGGERRINVAASRARSRMDVVSSIDSHELHVDNSGKGPRLLRDLIRFAETSGADTGAAVLTNPLNPFELAVKYELQQLGLDPISQYGSSGYRIDFALPHPSNDGRMVLAVEADGASYHSSRTARDRDRLRQEVLEAKGWKFHRIWSTAFFRDPKGEALEVKKAFDRALGIEPTGSAPSAPPPPPPTGAVQSSLPPPPPSRGPKPRLIPGRPITEYKHRELVALAKWLTNNGERLLTDEQIHDAMKTELGFQRSGVRINEAFARAIKDA